MPTVLSPADPWSPFVYGSPVDAAVSIVQGNFRPWAEAVAVVARTLPGQDEQYWNGSTFVSYDAFGFPEDSDTLPPTGAIAATMTHLRTWTATVPWGLIGSGIFTVRFHYRPKEQGPFYWAITGGVLHGLQIRGPASPNPAGVTVNSSFGGIDALRVMDSEGNAIEGVTVEARVPYSDDTLYYPRGTTTTGADGRWTFPTVMQPNTLHRLYFHRDGRQNGTATITTGAAA